MIEPLNRPKNPAPHSSSSSFSVSKHSADHSNQRASIVYMLPDASVSYRPSAIRHWISAAIPTITSRSSRQWLHAPQPVSVRDQAGHALNHGISPLLRRRRLRHRPLGALPGRHCVLHQHPTRPAGSLKLTAITYSTEADLDASNRQTLPKRWPSSAACTNTI